MQGGADGFIVENYGDAPFPAGPADPHVLAILSVVCGELRAVHPEALIGVNVLRNDARGAVGVALASGADFVRVNVHVGAMHTDQGILQSDAAGTLRYRQALGAECRIMADVLVKHASPLVELPAEQWASEAVERGGADGLIVTGRATGAPVDADLLAAVRLGARGRPVWVGSGVNAASARQWRRQADGAIVGTSLHRGGDIREPIDADEVVRLRHAFDAD
jgi:membrane complex biogenesis BtpA family protein